MYSRVVVISTMAFLHFVLRISKYEYNVTDLNPVTSRWGNFLYIKCTRANPKDFIDLYAGLDPKWHSFLYWSGNAWLIYIPLDAEMVTAWNNCDTDCPIFSY